MDRRQVLLGLALALGGPAALASCDQAATNDELLRSLRPSGRLAFYNAREYQFMGVLADAVIPRTDTPGAVDAGVPGYLDGMMATWASRATRDQHRKSIRDVRARLSEMGGKDFFAVADADRHTAIATLDTAAYAVPAAAGAGSFFAAMTGEVAPPETVEQSYRALKTLIAQVYYASEPGATEELHYELVPGRWLADAPLSQIGKTWAE